MKKLALPSEVEARLQEVGVSKYIEAAVEGAGKAKDKAEMTTSQFAGTRFGLLILFPFPFWIYFQPQEGAYSFLNPFVANSWHGAIELAAENNA